MTINAVNHTMRVGAGGVLEHPPQSTQTALRFASNNAAESDVRIVWDGAALLPRHSHTAIWKARYIQQNGYYAVAWHSPNTGSWIASYSYGTHPYPVDDELNPSYDSVSGGYNGELYSGGQIIGDEHCHEIANGSDIIACGSSITECNGAITPLAVAKGVWLTQARVSYVDGSNTVHEFWPDIDNNPSKKLVVVRATSAIDAGAGGNPAFYFGASDWTASGNSNTECPSCDLRFLKLFDTDLSLADIQTEAAAESNAAVTTAGIASIHYSNINPTVADITDKSGAGNDPVWPTGNTNRPTEITL